MPKTVARVLDEHIKSIEALLPTTIASKFKVLHPWVAELLGLPDDEVGIKYISGNKQTKNRLAERGSTRLIVAILREHGDLEVVSNRVVRLFEDSEITADAIALASKQAEVWAIRSVFEFEGTHIATDLRNFFPDLKSKTFPGPIVRSVEVPEPYRETVTQILNYFGRTLRNHFPRDDALVTVIQQGLRITLAINPPAGRRSEVENTLRDFGLVVAGTKSPEDLESDPLEVDRLRFELQLVKLRLEEEQRAGRLKQARIGSLEQRLSKALLRSGRQEVPASAFINQNIILGDNYSIHGQAGAVGRGTKSSGNLFHKP